MNNLFEFMETSPLFDETHRKILGFHSNGNEYLSNFYLCRLYYKGFWFTSSEQAYVWAKLDDRSNDWYNTIIDIDDGKTLKKFGKTIKLRKDWKSLKYTIMKEIVSAKFLQNPNLQHKLMNTGLSYIEETNNWNDTYWGVCNGVGENNLGKILMQIRRELTME